MADIYDNPDAPDAQSAPQSQAPITTASGTTIPTRTKNSPIASLIGKKDFGIEKLEPKDYYPTAGDSILVGTSGGKYIGNQPIFSGSGALYPYAIIDARRRALEQAAMLSKLQQQEDANVKHEALPSIATKSQFQEYLTNGINDAIKSSQSKYSSTQQWQHDYDTKGQAYRDVQLAATNGEAFKHGVDDIYKVNENVQKAREQGKYINPELEQNLNEMMKGGNLNDPNMVKKLTSLINQGNNITENLQEPVLKAADEISKNVSEQYVDIQKLVDAGKLKPEDAEGRREKILQTSITPSKIKDMADVVFQSHRAGAINELTTKDERAKLDDDQLEKITKDRLGKQIKEATHTEYKQAVEGSAPSGEGKDKGRNYSITPVQDQKKGIGAVSRGAGTNVLQQTTTAKNVWELKEPISAQLNNAKMYDVKQGKPISILGDVKVSFSTIQELPYLVDANGEEHILTDETLKKNPRLKPQYKRFASAIIDDGSTSNTQGSTFSPEGTTRTSSKDYQSVYVDYDSVKGILDERKIKLDEPGESKAESKTTSVNTIKGLVGKPGYEGYSEKELIDHYKKLGYTIK